MSSRVAVDATEPQLLDRAEALAAHCRLPLLADTPDAPWRLLLTPERLELRRADAGSVIVVDFIGGRLGYRRGQQHRRNELIARAVLGRAGPGAVLDATAGFGRDAFLLANLGCEVTMLERSPVVAALLRDGLERGLRNPGTADACARLTLEEGDAREWLRNLAPCHWPPVISLDPMFPDRRSTALAGKEMQALQALLDGDQDADELLTLGLGGSRVVVKRPRLAPYLGGRTPHHQLLGRSTRFDVYLPVSN